MFKGTYVALVTPFADGAVDFRALDELVDYVIAGGVSGLVPCGTTGESPTLSDEEQAQIIAAVVKRSRGRVPVLAGAGSNCTEHALALAQAAMKAGATSVMIVSPYYNRPSPRGLYQHFSYLASALGAPMVLYNIPGRTGVEIPIETIARLRADHANIVAVKHATGSIDGASELAAVSDIAILSGDDTLTAPLMAVGAVGTVSVVANLMPRETAALTTAALAGDLNAVRAAHQRLFPVARALMRLDTNPVPIKTALALGGMMAEEFRLPLCPMEPARRRELQTIVAPLLGALPARQPA